MRKMKFEIFVLSSLLCLERSEAFAPAITLFARSPAENPFQPKPENHRHCTPRLSMVNNNQFDMSRPTFDLLSLRTVRGDALVRYDALNQSEPLRIMLYALVAFSFFAAPSLSESVGYDDLGVASTIGSYVFGVSSLGLLVRECSRRSKQLVRIEKELNTESLPIRLPSNALSDMRFGSKTTLKHLRGLAAPPRIIAICGNDDLILKALQQLSVFGRRLQQANVYVIAIPFVGSSLKTSDLANSISRNSNIPWLADASEIGAWQDYFQSLNSDEESTSLSKFRWFGLTSRGTSFGSGSGSIPQWLQILGQHLRPTDFLDENDDVISSGSKTLETQTLMDAVQTFYRSLTTGDAQGIASVFSSTLSDDVSEVLEAGGRMDSWKDCLEPGARPEGMKVAGADSTLISDTEAYTTVIEFPQTNGMLDAGATLLAVQRWVRDDTTNPWKMELHQTIPWTPETKAQGTLRCDCRGCVALTRTQERRTFGGMVG